MRRTFDREASAERGERFCRRQPNTIGGTRDQDLLVVHGTTIQGSGHARMICSIVKDLALDEVRANGAPQQGLERCALTKSPSRPDLARRIGPGRNSGQRSIPQSFVRDLVTSRGAVSRLLLRVRGIRLLARERGSISRCYRERGTRIVRVHAQ
jgi:hypothetical protein